MDITDSGQNPYLRQSLGSKVEHNWNRYNGEQCGMVSWSLVPLVEDIKVRDVMCLGTPFCDNTSLQCCKHENIIVHIYVCMYI